MLAARRGREPKLGHEVQKGSRLWAHEISGRSTSDLCRYLAGLEIQSRDDSNRAGALLVQGEFDPRAVRGSLDKVERQRAVSALSKAVNGECDNQLDKEKRIGALWGLCAWQPELAVEPLLSMVKSRCRATRMRAQEIFTYLDGEKAIDVLLTNVRDNDPRVRAAVAGVLGRSKSLRVFEPLLGFLGADQEREVRLGAADAFGDLIGAGVLTLEQVTEEVRSQFPNDDSLYALLTRTANRLQRRLEPWGEEGAKLKEQRKKKDELPLGKGTGGIHVDGVLKIDNSVVAFPGGEVRDSSVNVVEGNHVEQRLERDGIVTPKVEGVAQEETRSDKVPRDACGSP